MNILLTNDDGIGAPGLKALYRRLGSGHTVAVVAPEREQSAVGHGITLHAPLRATPVAFNGVARGYAVNGTPADCVKLAVLELLDTRPDLVIAGINAGANLGVNINYSGTVAAAQEAALYGLAAIAVSIQGRQSGYYDEAARFVEKLAERVAVRGLPAGTFLNVNLPDRPLEEVAGVHISRLGQAFFHEYIEKRHDPRNRPYYWQGCDSLPAEQDPDVDSAVVGRNCISITPLKCDMTDYRFFEDLKHWEL